MLQPTRWHTASVPISFVWTAWAKSKEVPALPRAAPHWPTQTLCVLTKPSTPSSRACTAWRNCWVKRYVDTWVCPLKSFYLLPMPYFFIIETGRPFCFLKHIFFIQPNLELTLSNYYHLLLCLSRSRSEWSATCPQKRTNSTIWRNL